MQTSGQMGGNKCVPGGFRHSEQQPRGFDITLGQIKEL